MGFTLDSITVSVRSEREWTTMVREIGLPGVNVTRIAELERLARTLESGGTARTGAERLKQIESASPLYSQAQIAAAVGLASGAFAFLNGCTALEIAAAGIAAGAGQWSRSWLALRHINQYGVAALSGVIASGLYVFFAALAAQVGVGIARHPAGFISSVLFLVPGVPLVAALLDLLEHQTVAAVSRMAYGVMIFLAATFGLSIVVGIVRIDLSPQPALELAYPLKLLLRAAASFIGGFGFAVLFNSAARTALVVGFSRWSPTASPGPARRRDDAGAGVVLWRAGSRAAGIACAPTP